jgi:hypothetical protein
MRRLKKRIPIFLALTAFLFTFAPHTAKADAPAFDIGGCVDTRQQALYEGAQNKVVAAMNVFHGVPQPDFKNIYCWDSISALFTQLGTLMDPRALIIGLIKAFITSVLETVCSAITGIIDALTEYRDSFLKKLCIPIPGLGGALNFGIGNIAGAGACNGVPLIGPVPTIPENGYETPPVWDPWGMQQQ